MHIPSRTESVFTATLSAALLALGVTAFATAERAPAAADAVHVTMPAVTVVGDRAALAAELERALPAPAATAEADAAVQNEGSVSRKAS